MDARAALMLAFAAGCGDDLSSAQSSSTATFETTASDSTRASAAVSGSTAADSSSHGGTTAASTGADPVTCDLFANDCEAGTKCMAVGDGQEWTGTACMPLDPRAVGLGQACTVTDHPRSGLDNCGAQAICWFVDPESLTGECVGMCTSDTVDPGCDLPCGTLCTIATALAPPLCLPGCDPLMQDCPADRSCVAADTHFVCVRDESGATGAVGDSCESLAECDPGLFCLSASAWPDCPPSGGCCAPACDLQRADSCLDVPEGVSCQSWYGRGAAPPSTACTPFEQIGVCAAG